MIDSLAYAFGRPSHSGCIKQKPGDFLVEENLGFELQGSGEHVCIKLCKEQQNTTWVAEQLAKQLSVHKRAVSWAGLKDRLGRTQQWFSVHMPGKKMPDASALNIDNVDILEITRHHRKLRIGCLKGNNFKIRINELDLKFKPEIMSRLRQIKTKGVPNYFGPQRFGHELNNIDKARSMFAGKRVRDMQQRSFYLSAARSWLFNVITSARFEQRLAETILPGECLLLDGSRSFFTAGHPNSLLQQRFTDGDVHLSAPLWGNGRLPSRQQACEFELQVAHTQPDLYQGLEESSLCQERRALWLHPQSLRWEWCDGASLILQFFLPAGCFATSVIRELILMKES